MKINRKEFLSLSGMSILGFSLFNSLTGCGTGGSNKYKKGSGKVMIEVKTKRLQLAHTWTISRNSSDYKDNVFVKIEKNGIVGYGEAAPNVRYGENAKLTTEKIKTAITIFENNEFPFRDLSFVHECLLVLTRVIHLRE